MIISLKGDFAALAFLDYLIDVVIIVDFVAVKGLKRTFISLIITCMLPGSLPFLLFLLLLCLQLFIFLLFEPQFISFSLCLLCLSFGASLLFHHPIMILFLLLEVFYFKFGDTLAIHLTSELIQGLDHFLHLEEAGTLDVR